MSVAAREEAKALPSPRAYEALPHDPHHNHNRGLRLPGLAHLRLPGAGRRRPERFGVPAVKRNRLAWQRQLPLPRQDERVSGEAGDPLVSPPILNAS